MKTTILTALAAAAMYSGLSVWGCYALPDRCPSELAELLQVR